MDASKINVDGESAMAGDFPFVIAPVGGRDPNIWMASDKACMDDVLDGCGGVLLGGVAARHPENARRATGLSGISSFACIRRMAAAD